MGFFLVDTLTLNKNFPFGDMSGSNLSFTFDGPIICKTVKYIDQSHISFEHALGFDAYKFSRHVAD
jgi:hypothetical protein